MSDEETNSDNVQVFIQTIDFESLRLMTEKINEVAAVHVYQMPALAKSYVDEKGKLGELLQMLVDYSMPESTDKWRVKTLNAVPYANANECITIGQSKLLDVAECVVVPTLKSILIVPGDESVKSGAFSPADVIQLTGLISRMPLLMEIETVDDPEDSSRKALRIYFEQMS